MNDRGNEAPVGTGVTADGSHVSSQAPSAPWQARPAILLAL